MTIDEYIEQHSDAEPEVLARINRRTHLQLINPRMLSGHLQGRVLSMLCKMIKPKRILELGTFAGYSAICMAEALDSDGLLHTIEYDDELEEFIQQNIALAGMSDKIVLHIGEALKIISTIDDTFDLVFIDADKREYSDYFDAVFPKLKKGGYILADNTLWDGKVLKPIEANDAQTLEIDKFNKKITADSRVEKIILPIRDGITIIRKK